MRIFLHELRKILRPVPLLVSMLVLFLFQRTSILYYLRTLPVQSENACALEIYAGWREAYGPTLEPEELPGLENQLAALIAEANETIAHWDESIWAQYGSFSDEGIANYAEYAALLEQTNRNNTQNDVAALLLDSRTNFLHFRIATVQNMLENYDFERTGDLLSATAATDSAQYAQIDADPDTVAAVQESLSQQSPAQAPANNRAIRRCTEIADDPSMTHSIFYNFLATSASQFAIQLTLVSLLTVSLLTSPLLVQERLARMRQEQWPTRTGRGVLRYQLAAVLTVSAAVPVLLLAVFGTWYCMAWRTDVFWDAVAYSAGGSPIPWFTFTYGQYLLMLAAAAIGLSVTAGGLMFFLARFSGNYIAMLLKALPMFLALAYLSEKTLSDMLYFRNYLSDTTGLPGTEPLTLLLLLAGMLTLNGIALKRELSRELL